MITQLILENLERTPDYHKFADLLATQSYQAALRTWQTRGDEIHLVESLVNSLDNQHRTFSFRLFDSLYSQIDVRTHSKFVHNVRTEGTEHTPPSLGSQVKFKFQGEETKRELGDMIVVSGIYWQEWWLLLRIAIIQNKVARESPSGSIHVDQKQLYLLCNLPPMIGVNGFISPDQEVTFWSWSGALALYGIFYKPGDMLLVSARNLAEFLSAQHQIPFKKLKLPDLNSHTARQRFEWPFQMISNVRVFSPIIERLLELARRIDIKVYRHLEDRIQYRYHYDWLFNSFKEQLSQRLFCRDLASFIHALVRGEIGEDIVHLGTVINPVLSSLASSILQELGIKGLPIDKKIQENMLSSKTWNYEFRDKTLGLAAVIGRLDIEG